MDNIRVFWKVYLVVIPLHFVYMACQFTAAGVFSGKIQ